MGLPERSMLLWLVFPFTVELQEIDLTAESTADSKTDDGAVPLRQDICDCWWSEDVPVQVQPVAGDVQTHADLEQEGVGWIEQRQVHQQTHGGAAVRQHVQHGSKPGAWKETWTMQKNCVWGRICVWRKKMLWEGLCEGHLVIEHHFISLHFTVSTSNWILKIVSTCCCHVEICYGNTELTVCICCYSLVVFKISMLFVVCILQLHSHSSFIYCHILNSFVLLCTLFYIFVFKFFKYFIRCSMPGTFLAQDKLLVFIS